MSIQEIVYLSEILGRKDPRVKRMVQKALISPETAHIIRRHMLHTLRNMGYDLTDLPVFGAGPGESVCNDGIFAGHVVLGGKEIYKLLIPVDSFAEHSLVAGHSGSGKSYLIRMLIPQFAARGITVWIFDSEREYRSLLKYINPEYTIILSPKTDRDNFFEPPPGVHPVEWIAKLKNLCRECFYLRDGSINLLDNLLLNLFKNRGNLDGGNDCPCLPDLLNLLDRIEFRPGTRFSAYHESLVNRFRGLDGELGKTFNCRRGLDIRKLQRKIVIYEVHALSDCNRNFYINLKLMRESCYLENQPQMD
jgi:hypothetical protein